MAPFWIQAIGLGMLFHGALILWVGGLPHFVKRSGKAKIFWLEQYSTIGLALSFVGVLIATWGTVQ